ncbi:stress response translation initiation inhibitor YciH, partial [Shewanella sp. 30m-9]
MRIDPNIALVYSTDKGRIDQPKPPVEVPTGDGIVRIHKDSKGR